MFEDPRGPIEEFSWGRFVIKGTVHAGKGVLRKGVGKDIRLIGGQVSRWRERKGHMLEPAMLTGIWEEDLEVLVLGLGVREALQCPESVQAYLRENGIEEIILEATPGACATYNELYHQGKKVALLAHGTC
jgi:hypothetical protein